LTVLILMGIASFAFFILVFARNGAKQRIFDRNTGTRLDFKGLAQQFLSLASKQLAIILAIFFLFLALGYYIRNFGLLYSIGNIIYGASYTDVRIRIWVNRI